jgi:hypothetical protein
LICISGHSIASKQFAAVLLHFCSFQIKCNKINVSKENDTSAELLFITTALNEKKQ